MREMLLVTSTCQWGWQSPCAPYDVKARYGEAPRALHHALAQLAQGSQPALPIPALLCRNAFIHRALHLELGQLWAPHVLS